MRAKVGALARELRMRLVSGGVPPRATRSPTPEPAQARTDRNRPGQEGSKAKALEELRAQVEACRRCPLGSQRLKPAFGVGSPDAKVMFVGEGPGFEEDHQGVPFVGRAGQLLDKILASIGLSRDTVYIANILKCHAMVNPGNPELHGNDRPPSAEEAEACLPYLEEQMRIIQPKVVVTLGSSASRTLLQTAEGITTLRGKWREYRQAPGKKEEMDLFSPDAGAPVPSGVRGEGRPLPPMKVLPTYHPAALLRNPNLKRDVWEDMKALRKKLSEEARSRTP